MLSSRSLRIRPRAYGCERGRGARLLVESLIRAFRISLAPLGPNRFHHLGPPKKGEAAHMPVACREV